MGGRFESENVESENVPARQDRLVSEAVHPWAAVRNVEGGCAHVPGVSPDSAGRLCALMRRYATL